MRRILIAALAAGLAGCAHGLPASSTLLEMHQANDWAHAPGKALYAAMEKDVRRIARETGRAGTLGQLSEAGYECTYGEAHEDYPEPAAVCARSFASRACQFDWEVVLTSEPEKPGKVSAADVDFRRDCVGTASDWPVPVKSAIDDQLAPPPELPAQTDG